MLSCQHPVLRVLVVDDHELTRFSLKLALSSQKQIDLVGLASNGKEAIEMVERYRPDVIILDLQMPVMDGLSASSYIKSISPTTQIIAYSSVEDPQIEVMSQTAPIDIFCKKDTATKDLINLVKQLGSQKLNQLEGSTNQNYTWLFLLPDHKKVKHGGFLASILVNKYKRRCRSRVNLQGRFQLLCKDLSSPTQASHPIV